MIFLFLLVLSGHLIVSYINIIFFHFGPFRMFFREISITWGMYSVTSLRCSLRIVRFDENNNNNNVKSFINKHWLDK